MIMEQDIFKRFVQTRGLKKFTEQLYASRLKNYCQFQQMNLEELLEEAETEEEQGIRWKYRTIKTRLMDYRNYLQENYSAKTVRGYFHAIITFYKFYEIELYDLPPLNTKNLITSSPITFTDLPDKEIIKSALKISNSFYRAMILFMSSSGCARAETLSLTIADFIDATYEYHGTNDIYEAIEILHKKDDVVPTFKLKRIKTNKYYYTFCSPEAVDAIIMHLLSQEKKLCYDSRLFDNHPAYVLSAFAEINNKLNLGKVGVYNRFRSHMLRKFHASQLYNAGVSLEVVDALQGRGKDSTRSSYFMEDPNKLKEIYINHLNAVTINLNVENITFKSKEYNELEAKYENEKKTNEENSQRIDKLEAIFKNFNDDLLKKL